MSFSCPKGEGGIIPIDVSYSSNLEKDRQDRNKYWQHKKIAFCGDEKCKVENPSDLKCHGRGHEIFWTLSGALAKNLCEDPENGLLPRGGWQTSRRKENELAEGVTLCGCGWKEGQTRCDRTSVNNVEWNPLYRRLHTIKTPEESDVTLALKCCMWPKTVTPENRGLTEDEVRDCGNYNRGLISQNSADPWCVDVVQRHCNQKQNMESTDCVDFFEKHPTRIDNELLQRICSRREPNSANDKLCGCNYPPAFYANIKTGFKKRYKVGNGGIAPADAIRGGRHCWYAGCKSSGIKYAPDKDRECTDKGIVQCIQSIDANMEGTVLENAKVKLVNSAECKILN